ncbi:ribosomal protein L7/L12 [Streptomyces sp. LX-29]|uniref:ribosomal protein L7/L12 n=1 Tax=Streptomyces sp. LX-29 TaxID=2900152 RepID=UPI00240D5F57|nr:ribosomal protein L7/L12 [Streptomyces sp. LX-29]WFB06869.1 ribosomal protein L7/L12 [Streptomyces sp. LX-29]
MEISVLIVAFLVLVCIGGVETRIKRTERNIARVERKLDLVLDHLGLRESDPELERVEALVRDGKTIEAIKAYREATGAGLKEAKDAVDRMT